MHHSRNTAQKQWAETKVLTISGVARVFNTKRKLLRNMEDYSKAWLLLLEYVEKMCLSETSEVSLAALKAMQEMILSSKEEQGFEMKSGSNAMNETNWRLCWKAWINIGEQKTSYIRNTSDLLSYSQILLTGFIQIYTSLLPFVKDQFREQDIDNLGKVLCSCISITTDSDMMESTNVLGPVHSAALEAMKKTREIFPNKFTNGLFQIYFKFVSNAFTVSSDRSHILEKNLFFGENVIEEVGAYFSSMSENESNLSVLPFDQILHKIVQVLGIPLNKRYQWPKQTTWRVAINVLIKILRLGLPLVRKYQSFDYTPFWMELSTVLENFLFPECLQDMEDRFTDGAIDCHVIELLREEVLPYPKIVAVEFIRRFVILLNRGITRL